MTVRSVCFSAFSVSVLCLAGSADPQARASELGRSSSDVAPSGYVDARSYFTEPDDTSRWYDLTFRLRNEFDAICGDTFCEGDFANYESLGFRCSVEQRAGTLGECVWIFAASSDEVVPETGAIAVESEAWRCPMPLAPETSAAEFLAALSIPGERSLYAPLPGTDRVLYDGLTDCL